MSKRRGQYSSNRSDKKKANQQANSVRIIAGQYRGRRLPVLDVEGLRPSTDRVRETVFNWLMHEVSGANCLDLFAGTGAFGFECVSRGSAKTVWVEANRQVAEQLNRNFALLDQTANQQQQAAAQVAHKVAHNVVQQRAENFLSQTSNDSFDIVFIDPPYQSQCQAQVCQLLEENNWLQQNAFIYVEQMAKTDLCAVPDTWQLHRQGQTKQSIYTLYKRQ